MNTTGRRDPEFLLLGKDTFRGVGPDSTMLRTELYNKNEGHHTVKHDGLARTESAVSGNILVSAHQRKDKIRDPIAGCSLRIHGDRATVTAPATKQQFAFSKKFYNTKDIDLTIQTLRNTTKFNRYTNEKVGTAGTPTGMDKRLTTYEDRT